MSLFSLLPEDLKRETSRYLHKKYYEIVLDELIVMTMFIKHDLNVFTLSVKEGIIAVKAYTDITTGYRWIYYHDYPRIALPRWDFVFDKYNDSKRKSIYEIKNDIEKNLTKE